MSTIPTVPHYPDAVGHAHPVADTPAAVPVIAWRPGTPTVSYAGPRPYEIADRLPRARAQHAAAIADARRARCMPRWARHVEHARALRRAAWARENIRQLLTCQRALDTVWFDRRWFYFDDPEYARRTGRVLT